MQGNDGGPVIVPGNIKESILFEVITLPPDDDMIMPPKGDPLTADQIELFRRWILKEPPKSPRVKSSQHPHLKMVKALSPKTVKSFTKHLEEKEVFGKVLCSYSRSLRSGQGGFSSRGLFPNQANPLILIVMFCLYQMIDVTVTTTHPLNAVVGLLILKLRFGSIPTNK